MKEERQRYILFKIVKEDPIFLNEKILLNSIWHSIWKYFGMKGATKIGLWLVEFNIDDAYGIIRCSHITKEMVISALTMIQEISGVRIILSPIKTSGTLNKIKKVIKLNK
jgi:RNase P/RNase MRP subunit POP5